jgi:glycosyltransferase involved in cell wall biosynthesis
MPTLRLLAIIEAATITGPAKNLLQFAKLARSTSFDPAVEVSIAVFQRPGAPQLFLDTARQAGIPVHTIPERGRFDRSVVATLRALVKDLRPDLIQSHAVKSHFLTRQAGLHRLAPWVAFHHGYTWPDLRARLYNQLDRWSLRAASQVLTVSLPFRDELARHGVSPGRIQVVHNAIDAQWGAAARCPEAAAALRARWGIPAESKVILIVGRLSREKDHRTLIEAVGRLKAVDAAIRPHLLIVGEGPERAVIEPLIRDRDLAGSVTLTGQAPSAEPYYGIADVAVLSSLSEGSPNALLEAMAANVPAVATDVGGIPEIVKDGESALLIPPRDREAMTAAIARVLTGESLRRKLTTRAHELILAHHTPESRVRCLIEIYRQVLEAR